MSYVWEDVATTGDDYTVVVTYFTDVMTSVEITDIDYTPDFPTQATTGPPTDGDPFFTPRIILGIAIATATALLFLLVVFICLMAYRNKNKANSNSDDLSESSSIDFKNSSFDIEDAAHHSGSPKRAEYSWAFSNGGLDVTGDEGIEADLDPKTENQMKHLAATFNAGGPYQPRQIRANFDRDSFYAEYDGNSSIHVDHTQGVGNMFLDQNPKSSTFFRGELPATPL